LELPFPQSPARQRSRARPDQLHQFLSSPAPRQGERHTLRPAYTLGLGLISLFLFLILVVTGVLLMFYYVPSTNQAYDRMLDLLWNFFATMKGQWQQLRDNVPLKFLMSGTVFYLLTCFQGPMHSLRTVNAIVSKTDWIPGHAHMALLGCFSFYAIAGTYYVAPRLWRTGLYSDKLANWTFWLMMIGGLGFFVTLWLGGLLARLAME
jgi:cbb3-type cytochrome oxidase subunit 1